MKKLIAALMLGTALVSPALARDVTISAGMVRYSGNAAYVAVYLTKPDGSYDSTLWLSGTKQRYLGELRGWIQAVQQSGATSLNIDGITGASVVSAFSMGLRPARVPAPSRSCGLERRRPLATCIPGAAPREARPRPCAERRALCMKA